MIERQNPMSDFIGLELEVPTFFFFFLFSICVFFFF
jgi:hypothetical protein